MIEHLNIRNGLIKNPYLRAPCRNRTNNLRIGLYRGFEPREKFSPTLYSLDFYHGLLHVYKCAALPIELTGHLLVRKDGFEPST